MGKNLSNRYGQKFLDSAKKFTTDAIKTASKRAERMMHKEQVIKENNRSIW